MIVIKYFSEKSVISVPSDFSEISEIDFCIVKADWAQFSQESIDSQFDSIKNFAGKQFFVKITKIKKKWELVWAKKK